MIPSVLCSHTSNNSTANCSRTKATQASTIWDDSFRFIINNILAQKTRNLLQRKVPKAQ